MSIDLSSLNKRLFDIKQSAQITQIGQLSESTPEAKKVHSLITFYGTGENPTCENIVSV